MNPGSVLIQHSCIHYQHAYPMPYLHHIYSLRSIAPVCSCNDPWSCRLALMLPKQLETSNNIGRLMSDRR